MTKRRGRGEGSLYLRGKTWWIQYRDNGLIYRESAGTEKKTEAVGFLQQRIAEIRTEGKSRRDLENITLGELMGDYLLYFDQKGKRDKERVFTVFGHFAGLQAPELTEAIEKVKKSEMSPDQLALEGRRAILVSDAHIESYKKQREEEETAHSTINRELDVIRRIFKLGVERRKVRPFRSATGVHCEVGSSETPDPPPRVAQAGGGVRLSHCVAKAGGYRPYVGACGP